MVENEIDTLGELEVVENEIKQQEEQKQVELPEKFKGKSLEQIAEIALNTEKRLSRQGQELGEVRRLADELLREQLQSKTRQQEKKPEVDFFENPQEAIRQAVETNPVVVAAGESALHSQRMMAFNALNQKHPDKDAIVKDENFLQWVVDSPVRKKLFVSADKGYDFDAADELLTTYKQLNAMKQDKVTEVDKTARNQSLKAAAVDTGGSGESVKKIYKRSSIINLRIQNPTKFAEMSDEISKAYAEGRVR